MTTVHTPASLRNRAELLYRRAARGSSGGKDTPLGFQEQGTAQCGTYSIQHAMLVLGYPVSHLEARKAARVLGPVQRILGVDEKDIIGSIRRLGHAAQGHIAATGATLQRTVDRYLALGCPVIVVTQDEQHWYVIAGRERGHYLWIDSNEKPVVGALRWSDLEDDMNDSEVKKPKFYVIGVRPCDPRHSLVPGFAAVKRLIDAEPDLGEYWGSYLEDLRLAFDCPPTGVDCLSAAAVFDTYREELLLAACYQVGGSDVSQAQWELDCYAKVATAHRLTVSRGALPIALTRLSAALTALTALA